MQEIERKVKAGSRFSEEDIKTFQEGTHISIYEKLGSHLMEVDGEKGVYFAVWAPWAEDVSVVGDFNYWAPEGYQLYPRWDSSGIWEGFVPGLEKGTLYKYAITTKSGQVVMKGDPYAKRWEHPPQTASMVWEFDYEWDDKSWLKKRSKEKDKIKPYSCYEVHLESWRRKSDGSPLTYRELAETLVPYVKEMGFTHVEFMPVMEYPYSPSWGYQITGYYAASSRFGQPEGLMYLIDQFHQAEIGVILDWVPSHFPTDAHGIAQFDGSYLYEHEDPRQGFHPDWKSAIFNYGKNEVASFLLANAIYWLKHFHVDGLRVDAVASMLYLDYSREDGEWVANKHGSNENLEAISFLKRFNETVYQQFPDTVTIAEESTAWTGVSRPTYEGGLGFGQKWMMGWMHDTLKFFSEDPINRKYHHDTITFSQVYAYSENFMLPFSHDEVVHGKAPLIHKMPGDEWQKFANLRLMYSYMFTHPGTKLLFMGCEFAQTSEWNFKGSLDWDLQEYAPHQGIQKLIKKLNSLYRKKEQLYELQFDPEGFEWLDIGDRDNSVISYFRNAKSESESLLIVHNFTPVLRDGYSLGLHEKGSWKEIFNSDHEDFGGAGNLNKGKLKTEEKESQGKPHTLKLVLPPLGCIILEEK